MATEASLPSDKAARQLARIYASAQRTIMLQVQAALRSGNLQRAAERRMQLAAVLSTLDQLGAQADPLARDMVRQAVADGSGLVARDLAATLHVHVGAVQVPGSFTGVSLDAVKALEDSILGRLRTARQTVGRQVDDVYARAGRRQALRALLGAEGSPRTATRALSADLRARGMTGFVDKAGKQWALDTYSEMAVRTVTREAVVQGQLVRMASHGVNLARISEHASACAICKPWEGRLVSLDGGTSEFQGEAVADIGSVPTPPFHPNCVAAGTIVETTGRYGAFRAPYSGDLIHLTSASGIRLAITPNHPVMTAAGWLPAGELRQGDHVLRAPGGRDAITAEAHDLDDVPSAIEDVFDALLATGVDTTVAAAGDDFHGDARCFEGEVDVVLADRELLRELTAEVDEGGCECGFLRTDVREGLSVPLGALAEQFVGLLLAADGGMGGVRGSRADHDTGGSQLLAHRSRCDASVDRETVEPFAGEVAGGVLVDVLDRDARGLARLSLFAARSDVDAGLLKLGAHAGRARLELAGAVSEGHARGVVRDQLVSVDRRAYSGHVYDLSVRDGHYLANGLIVSNCRHTLEPVVQEIELLRQEMGVMV